MKKTLSAITVVLVMVCTVGYGRFVDNTEPDANIRRARITPSLVRLKAGTTQQFRVIMSPRHLKFATLAENVKWSVNGVPGGNRQLGTIDADGIYQAPARPERHEINIRAEVPGATNRYVFATVLLAEPESLYRFVREWSETTDPNAPDGRLEDPHGLCLDLQGNLLIVDRKKPYVMRYSVEGEFLGEVRPDVGEAVALTEGRAVIVDKQGRIWACDQEVDQPRLHIYSCHGEHLHDFGHQGVGPGQLLRVHGTAFDSKGRLFVVDVDNFRVNVYANTGKFLYCWGKAGLELGEFNAPHGIMVDPSGDVFVSNYYGPTQKFDPNGHLLCAFAYADPPDGPIGFHSISGDRWGNVYMTVRCGAHYGGEYKAPTKEKILHILKYNNNGDYVTGWSLAKPQDGPSWIAVADDGTVYCLFTAQDRVGVQVFRPQ